MLIDKINLFYKSSKRLPILFSTMDNIWIKQVNNLKSFKDVVELAKKMLNWQKKEIEKQKENGSLSDSIDKLYKLSDDHKRPEADFGASGARDEASNEREKKR